MVIEKGGIIRHYDMVSGQPIFSLDCHNTPVTSADWSHCDSTLVGAVAGSSWYLWDISQSRCVFNMYLDPSCRNSQAIS